MFQGWLSFMKTLSAHRLSSLYSDLRHVQSWAKNSQSGALGKEWCA
jgi:hypothetical protein